MSNTYIIALCLAAVFLSIALNAKFKQNTGLFAIVFAYLIGCYCMQKSVGEVISYFSIKILFLMFSVCLFYGYAVDNGTLAAIANRVIYQFRNHTRLLPFVLYAVCFLLSALGAGAPAVNSFMAPICFAIGAQTGIHWLIMVALMSGGAGAGSCVPWSQGGVIIRGILETVGYADSAFGLTMTICLNYVIASVVSLTALYLFFKGYRAKPVHLEKPAHLNAVQKKNLILVLIVMALILIPAIVQIVYSNPITAVLSEYCDVQMLCIVGAVFCALLKLGDERKIIRDLIPWSSIIAVCGVCMLIGVASSAGVTELISSRLQAAGSPRVIAALLILIGGFMSFFTGGMTVVAPMLLPIAVSIAAEGGMNLTLLASAAVLSGMGTCVSPYSSNGAVILACMTNESERGKRANRQFLFAFVNWGIYLLLGLLGVYGAFG